MNQPTRDAENTPDNLRRGEEKEVDDTDRQFFQKLADLCVEYGVLFWEEDFRLSLLKKNTYDVHYCRTIHDGLGNLLKTRFNIRKVNPKIIEIESKDKGPL